MSTQSFFQEDPLSQVDLFLNVFSTGTWNSPPEESEERFSISLEELYDKSALLEKYYNIDIRTKIINSKRIVTNTVSWQAIVLKAILARLR